MELVAVPPASGEPFRLGAEPPSVMRLSRKALAILGAALGTAIGGALLYALQPAKLKVAENLYDSDRANKSELVTGAPGDLSSSPRAHIPNPGCAARQPQPRLIHEQVCGLGGGASRPLARLHSHLCRSRPARARASAYHQHFDRLFRGSAATGPSTMAAHGVAAALRDARALRGRSVADDRLSDATRGIGADSDSGGRGVLRASAGRGSRWSFRRWCFFCSSCLRWRVRASSRSTTRRLVRGGRRRRRSPRAQCHRCKRGRDRVRAERRWRHGREVSCSRREGARMNIDS